MFSSRTYSCVDLVLLSASDLVSAVTERSARLSFPQQAVDGKRDRQRVGLRPQHVRQRMLLHAAALLAAPVAPSAGLLLHLQAGTAA